MRERERESVCVYHVEQKKESGIGVASQKYSQPHTAQDGRDGGGGGGGG